jgi:predicted nucleotidyltransferase
MGPPSITSVDMISRRKIRSYCAAIAREFKPKRIVLFGSYAYGTPTDDSDVDVLVILPRGRTRSRRPSLEIRRRIHAGFPVDILVREPREIKKRLRWQDSFIREIIDKGLVMYEAGDA